MAKKKVIYIKAKEIKWGLTIPRWEVDLKRNLYRLGYAINSIGFAVDVMKKLLENKEDK